MCIADRYDMTLAIKVTLSPNTIQQQNFDYVLWYM